MPSYHLEVITPQGVAYQGEVIHTSLPAEDGLVGVLANHAPYVTSSSGGSLQVRETDGKEKKFRIGAGFFEVAKNRATFLTQSFSVEDATNLRV